jgi:hypothetical protein
MTIVDSKPMTARLPRCIEWEGEFSMLLDRSAPRDGDVLITRETQHHVHYTVRQLPGFVQFSAAGRDDAVRLAVEFGRRYSVDVWYGEAGVYRLLRAHRFQASADAPARRAIGT